MDYREAGTQVVTKMTMVEVYSADGTFTAVGKTEMMESPGERAALTFETDSGGKWQIQNGHLVRKFLTHRVTGTSTTKPHIYDLGAITAGYDESDVLEGVEVWIPVERGTGGSWTLRDLETEEIGPGGENAITMRPK